jgi:hypothetical protein
MSKSVARALPRVLAGVLLSVSASAHANAVDEWTLIGKRVVAQSEQDAAAMAHAMSMVHVVMFEVLNFIEARYVSRFVVAPPQPLRMSRPAAAASAAHQMLVLIYPSREQVLDGLLEAALARLPDGIEKSSAVIEGRSLAHNVYALRASVAPLPARRTGVGESPLAWSGIVSDLAAARGLDILDAARVHALVSTAISQSFAASEQAGGGHRLISPATMDQDACTPCVAGAAVRVILEAEFGTAGTGREIGRRALMQWTRVGHAAAR